MVDKPLAAHTDDQPVELGLSTMVDRDGYLTDARIRRGAYTGELVVRVHNPSGTRIAQVTTPPDTGVQAVRFAPSRTWCSSTADATLWAVPWTALVALASFLGIVIAL
ncbi:DUF4082 domain-containing protein, partial [Saccharothrix sp. MB29]|nr:DUF4082 domain-containing protein [Saccharothrix sp. MB29]